MVPAPEIPPVIGVLPLLVGWDPGVVVELRGEDRYGVREGIGLLGVGDVTTVVEFDEPRVGERGGEPVGDGAQCCVAAVTGDDEGRHGHRREVRG